jgi:putative transposase
VDFETSKLSLPKFRTDIKIVLHRPFEGKIKTTTISKTPTGKYFASILVEVNEEIPTKAPIDENKAVGIDIGIKTFAVLSDGLSIENPRNLKRSLKRLKQRQRALSRKKKGSNNRNKAKVELAIVHEKVTNQRLDFLHKTSKVIVQNYDTICLEALTAKNMMKNHKLAQALSDISIGKFNDLLEYKAEWYGKNILRIGRFEPSSRLCTCGVINKELKLSDRVWTCKNCNTTHDRDVLASNNIKRMAFHSQNKIREEHPKSTLGSYESQ